MCSCCGECIWCVLVVVSVFVVVRGILCVCCLECIWMSLVVVSVFLSSCCGECILCVLVVVVSVFCVLLL